MTDPFQIRLLENLIVDGVVRAKGEVLTVSESNFYRMITQGIGAKFEDKDFLVPPESETSSISDLGKQELKNLGLSKGFRFTNTDPIDWMTKLLEAHDQFSSMNSEEINRLFLSTFPVNLLNESGLEKRVLCLSSYFGGREAFSSIPLSGLKKHPVYKDMELSKTPTKEDVVRYLSYFIFLKEEFSRDDLRTICTAKKITFTNSNREKDLINKIIISLGGSD